MSENGYHLLPDGSLALSPRVTLYHGSAFRVSKGPYYNGTDGKVSVAARGKFRFICAYKRKRGRRIYVAAQEIVNVVGKSWMVGARVDLYADGPTFRHKDLPGVTMRPYKLKRVKP